MANFPPTKIVLKGLLHFIFAFLANAVSWLFFVVAIFMAHGNDNNNSKSNDSTCRACWINRSFTKKGLIG